MFCINIYYTAGRRQMQYAARSFCAEINGIAAKRKKDKKEFQKNKKMLAFYVLL
jgi:hypothetical protein